MENREYSIDVLRFIGLSLIILAHVSPPYWLQQARCFDVPLMLFISGLTCSNKAIASYKDFVVKRFKRLVYPVWFFLILYFTLILIAQSFNLIPNYLTGRKILESFLLLDGIGYVWIIRVFLLIMLITPLLQKINNVIKNDYVFIVAILALLSINEIVLHLDITFSNIVQFIVSNYVAYALGYSALFLIGLRLRFADKKTIIRYVLIWAIIFIILTYNNIEYYGVINITGFKYPPQLFFLTYGIFVSCFLWAFKELFAKISLKTVLFVGKNTIWIYLWHIPFVILCNKYIEYCALRYLICYFSAIIIFYLQYQVVNKYLKNRSICKYLIG